MKKHATYITIIGNIGSGKTTLIPYLQKELNASVVHADDFFQHGNPFRDQFLQDMQRWSLANELWLTKERAALVRRHMQRNTKQTTLIDSGLLMSWVYAHSHFLVGKMTKEEWELYEGMYNMLAKDITDQLIVVHLVYSQKTLLKRIHKRGRAYEIKEYKKDYLEQLDKGLVALAQKLRKEGSQIITIRESDVPDFEANTKDRMKVLEKIKGNLLDKILI